MRWRAYDRRFRGLGLAFCAAALLFAAPARSAAHTLPISFLRLVPDSNTLHLELMINAFELNFFSELDANHDGRLDPRELAPHAADTAQRIADALEIWADGARLRPFITGVVPDDQSHHLFFRAHYRLPRPGAEIRLRSALANLTSGSHVTEVAYGRAPNLIRAQLTMGSETAVFRPAVSAADEAVMRESVLPLRGRGFLVLSVAVVLAMFGWAARDAPAAEKTGARTDYEIPRNDRKRAAAGK